MNSIDNITQKYEFLNQFNLKANQVVEGFISGIHKSPFHGFSSEFSEHKIYNPGENTKNIDWKVYAKTNKLYTKKYDDETNLRCHIIIDNSSSMYYPVSKNKTLNPKSKIEYAAIASASILKIIKKQRDAAGLTIYSDKINFHAKEFGSERHHKFLIEQLNHLYFSETPKNRKTNTIEVLHEIAEKTHQRSMIILFSDMFLSNTDNTALLKALQHLKHKKNKVILFHVIDKKTELEFDFDNEAKKFIDLESGEIINLHTDQAQDAYLKLAKEHFNKIKSNCNQYKIDYFQIDISEKIEKTLTTYFTERQKLK